VVPIIEVWNKIDHASAAENMADAEHDPDFDSLYAVLRTSAVTGEGLDALLHTIDEALSDGEQDLELLVPYAAGAAMAWLHEFSNVLAHENIEEGTRATVRISDDDWGKLQKRFPTISTL
jgi:GTP-binding protein HflX